MNRVFTAVVLVLAVTGAIAPVAAQSAFVEEPANLHVEQPHYVDGEAQATTTGDITTYEARGSRLLLAPENFPQESVTEFGVATDQGTLSFDRDLGVYEFQAPADGTYEVYWIVDEQRTINGTNESVSVRYAARLNVSGTEQAHVPPSEIQGNQEAAESWENWRDSVLSEEVAGPDANIEQQTQIALNLLRLRHHPMAALTGQFTGLLLTLFLTLSGLVLVAITLLLWLRSRWRDIVELRRKRQLDAERADLEDELEEYDRYQQKAALEGLDWNDIFPDDIARAFRDHLGETVLDGWLRMQDVLSPRALVRDRLHAMRDDYVAVERAQPDGGESSPGEGPVYDLIPKGETREDTDAAVRELGNPDDELVEGVDWDDPNLREFDLAGHGDDEPLGGSAMDIEDVIDELGVDLRDFDDDKEVFAQYLTEFLQTVVDHEYTDHDGRVRPVRHALNLWLRALRHIGEREGVPTARYQAEYVNMMLQTYDREEEIADFVDRVELGGGAD